METILQLSRRMAHNSSPSSMDMKYSPTDSLKLSNRDNKRIERRKPNWTEAENVFLLDQFALHREILTCKATDASTNLKKQEIWRLICQNLNTHNTLVRRTPAEVRRKWKNLVTAAKKEVWEMRHQIHLSGGSGANGRKISDLSQRVLQLHSSGGFSGANPNGLYGTLLSAGLLGPPSSVSVGGAQGDKYSSKFPGSENTDDKSYIPAHFTPIITLSESNNNHISLMGSSGHSGDDPPSPLSEDDDDESSDSRNATEFMSDSGIYEQEGIDLRVNRSNGGAGGNGVLTMGNGVSELQRNANSRHLVRQLMLNNNNKSSDPGDDEEAECDDDVEDMSLIRYMGQRFGKSLYGNIKPAISYGIKEEDIGLGRRKSSDVPEDAPNAHSLNGDLIDATLKLRNHFLSTLKESDLLSSLYKERLELQIEVLKLRKQKLTQELKPLPKRLNGVIRKPKFHKLKRSMTDYLKLKPKNTWINFAAKEKLLLKDKDCSDKGTNTEAMVNGVTNGESDTEESK